MSEQLTLQDFENDLVKFKEKTKNYPWANIGKHRDHVAKEGARLIGWVHAGKREQALDIVGRVIL